MCWRLWLLLVLLFPWVGIRAQETSMVPVKVDGKTVRLVMRIYKPDKAGPVPTLVFNHGSTGRGRDPMQFNRPIDFPQLAQFFVQRGWAVVMPARRGRAGSEGQYDEGFEVDRARGYSCDKARSRNGFDRALRDLDAAMTAILAMPFVDQNRIVIGGHSRGGILSVAYAGKHPARIKGVINFVGGWLGTGCPMADTINQAIFKQGARYPSDTIWLYAEGDLFYSLAHSRKNFEAFQAAGGKGSFIAFTQSEAIGHRLVSHPDVWASTVDAYLKGLEQPIRKD